MKTTNPVERDSLINKTKFSFEEYKNWKGYWELIDGQAHEVEFVSSEELKSQVLEELSREAEVSDIKFYPFLKFNEDTCLRPFCYFKKGSTKLVVEVIGQNESKKVELLKSPIYSKFGIELIRYSLMV